MQDIFEYVCTKLKRITVLHSAEIRPKISPQKSLEADKTIPICMLVNNNMLPLRNYQHCKEDQAKCMIEAKTEQQNNSFISAANQGHSLFVFNVVLFKVFAN